MWWRGTVLYSIYPASFFDRSGDGIGDLAGIAAKIDHLENLGVAGFWLQPIYPSPFDDCGYDITDFRDVDPRFGTLDDFDHLVSRCHARGLKLIVDQVWGHSSSRHPWFVQSRRPEPNPYSDWYVWADAKPDGTEPNNWRSITGGPAWTWDRSREQYYMHQFLRTMPHLDGNNPEVQQALLDIARFWLDRGADGIRFDVINTMMTDPQLRDNPARPCRVYNPLRAQEMVNTVSRPEVLPFVERVRALVDGYPDRFTVAELFGGDPLDDEIDYAEGERRFHSAYHILAVDTFDPAKGTLAQQLRAEIERWDFERAWPTWTFATHDTLRSRSRLGGHDAPDAFSRALMTVLMGLRGTVMIFQGEELGLPGGPVPLHRKRDFGPIRDYPGGYDRDQVRTPMPWRYGVPHAGFSPVEPWMPLEPAHELLSVDVQDADPGSTLNWTRRLIQLRNGSDALGQGNMRFPDAPAEAFVVERWTDCQRIVVAANLSTDTVTIQLPGEAALLACDGAVGVAGDLELSGFASALLEITP